MKKVDPNSTNNSSGSSPLFVAKSNSDIKIDNELITIDDDDVEEVKPLEMTSSDVNLTNKAGRFLPRVESINRNFTSKNAKKPKDFDTLNDVYKIFMNPESDEVQQMLEKQTNYSKFYRIQIRCFFNS